MHWRLILQYLMAVSAMALVVPAFIIIQQSSYRSVDYSYSISVRAPDDLNWTLWLPSPEAAMSLEATGTVLSISSVQTAYGFMDNVTGRGNVSILWTMHRSVYAPEGNSFHTESSPLSGWNASGYWIWRESVNTTAVIQVTGGQWWVANSRNEKDSCGGPNYVGAVSERWSIAATSSGECFTLISSGKGLPTAAGLLAASLIIAVGAVLVGLRGKHNSDTTTL